MKNKITVLIADDNSIMRETLSILFSGTENIRLIGEARNGDEAIVLAKELLPDIILMDINMEPVNGFEATQTILEQNPAARIIGISMHRKPSYSKNMQKLGAKGYISKGASPDEILEAIKQVAEGGKNIDKNIKE